MLAIRQVTFIPHLNPLYQTIHLRNAFPFSLHISAQLGVFQKTAIPAQFRVDWLRSKYRTSEWEYNYNIFPVHHFHSKYMLMTVWFTFIFGRNKSESVWSDTQRLHIPYPYLLVSWKLESSNFHASWRCCSWTGLLPQFQSTKHFVHVLNVASSTTFKGFW